MLSFATAVGDTAKLLGIVQVRNIVAERTLRSAVNPAKGFHVFR